MNPGLAARGVSRRVTVLVVSFAAAIAAAPAGAWAQETVELDEDPAEVRRYWTPERMREAIPAGPLGSSEAAAKGGGTIAKKVSRPGRRPKRSHGKVFFRLDGVDYVCSGTSVRAPAENVVWTAGHCVYDMGLTGPQYASRWMFAPAYRDGKASKLGRWVATDLTATPQWRNCGIVSCDNFAHDFGAANVANLGGKTLQDRVRGRKIEFHGPRDQVYRAFGYPAGSPFNGRDLYRCTSPWMGNDNTLNPPPLRIRCDMTGGASGGGWVVDGGKVASVVSYGYPGEDDDTYGPYQGFSAESLYDQVKNG